MSRGLEQHPSALSVHASLRIQGGGDPHTVTHQLGLQPSGIIVSGSAASWMMTSTGTVSTKCPSCHLSWIADQLDPRRDQLGQLIASGWQAKTALFWLADSSSEGPLISAEVMSRIGALGLPLFVDFHSSSV